MNSPAHQSIWFQQTLEVSTEGRGTTDVTEKVADVVIQAGVRLGLCHIFVQHTSASVILTENADRNVHDDLELFMESTVPDSLWKARYQTAIASITMTAKARMTCHRIFVPC